MLLEYQQRAEKADASINVGVYHQVSGLQEPGVWDTIESASEDKPLPCRIFFNKKSATGVIVAAYLLHKSGGDLLKTF